MSPWLYILLNYKLAIIGSCCIVSIFLILLFPKLNGTKKGYYLQDFFSVFSLEEGFEGLIGEFYKK